MFASRIGTKILLRSPNSIRFFSGVPAVSVSLVAQLRKNTGASIQKCKEALENTQGDMKGAIELLRKRGEDINSRSSAPVGGSRIAGSRSPDGRKAVITRTTSLTDFASESELFVKFSESVNLSVSSMATMEMRDVPPTLELHGKISDQIHGKTLIEVVSELSSILSEPVTVSNIDVVEGDLVSLYVHGKSPYSLSVGSMACSVSFRVEHAAALTAEQKTSLFSLGNCVARQVLATNPRYVTSADIPEVVIQKEKETLRSRIKNPEAFEKAFVGYMRKVESENCLLGMEWIIPLSTWSVTEGSTVEVAIDAVCKQIGLSPGSVTVDRFIVRK